MCSCSICSTYVIWSVLAKLRPCGHVQKCSCSICSAYVIWSVLTKLRPCGYPDIGVSIYKSSILFSSIFIYSPDRLLWSSTCRTCTIILCTPLQAPLLKVLVQGVDFSIMFDLLLDLWVIYLCLVVGDPSAFSGQLPLVAATSNKFVSK